MNRLKIISLALLGSLNLLANSGVPELEDFQHIVCHSENAHFILSGIKPVVLDDPERLRTSREGFFIFQVNAPNSPEEILVSTHGTGKLEQLLSMRVIFNFKGPGAFSHMPGVEVRLLPESFETGTADVTVDGQVFENLSCKYGLN